MTEGEGGGGGSDGSVMVNVSLVVAPSVALVGVPRVTVNVWLGPKSGSKAPLIVAVVWPALMTSGLMLTLL